LFHFVRPVKPVKCRGVHILKIFIILYAATYLNFILTIHNIKKKLKMK